MIEDIHQLSYIKGNLLDEYLACGWYRMGRFIFTTSWLAPYNDGQYFPVFWLRYVVNSVRLSDTGMAIKERCSRFNVAYRPFELTEEITSLHRLYTSSLRFETSKDLVSLLNDTNNDVFDTYIIEVRDNGRLIAAGIFDLGEDAIAGIINIYHPDYKKYSLGKYLMLLKYQFCTDSGLSYYYPGYYSPTYPAFDYKLFLDKRATEVYVPLFNDWYPYFDFSRMMLEQ